MNSDRIFPKEYYDVCNSNSIKKSSPWFCNKPLSPRASDISTSATKSSTLENETQQNEPGTSKSCVEILDNNFRNTDLHYMRNTDFDYSPNMMSDDGCPNDNNTDSDFIPCSISDKSSASSFIDETDFLDDSDSTPTLQNATMLNEYQTEGTNRENLIESMEGSSTRDNRFTMITEAVVEKHEKQNTAVTEETGEDYKEVSQDANVNTKQTKTDFCYYCEKSVQCFARHIRRNHSYEPEVQKIFSYPPKHKMRLKYISDLRKRGNYLNSRQVMKPVRKNYLGNDLLPCTSCLGFYTKTHLWRHRKKCCANLKTQNTQNDAQTFMIGQLKVDEELKRTVFPRMRADKISLVAKTDELICAFGAQYLKIHREAHFVNVASRKMRELARLVIEIKKHHSNFRNLFQMLKPEHFDKIVEATKNVAKFNQQEDKFISPTYALNICKPLKQCCEIAIYALKKKHFSENVSSAEVEADLKTFIELIESHWKYEISNKAGNDLNQKKWNKITLIPLATDLKKFKNFLIKKGNEAFADMERNGSHESFRKLIETVYCKLILLNRRRPGELQRLTVSSYQEFASNDKQNYEEFMEAVTPAENILMKRFKRIVIRGKRGRGVPVLLSTDVQEHLQVIVSRRNEFLKKSNPYLFANINSSEPIVGYKILKKYATQSGAKNPEGITCTKLRKHLATLSQIFNMTETDLEQLATFMGHTIGIHRQSYRLPDDVYQTSKIAKILLLMEQGELGEVKGKTLDQIEINMDEDLLEIEEDNDPIENEMPLEIENVDGTGGHPNGSPQPSTSKCKEKTLEKNKELLKKGRSIVKWTEEQKQTATEFFSSHIKNSKAPKKSECEEFKKRHKDLFRNKDWLKIKVFIQNKYTGKSK